MSWQDEMRRVAEHTAPTPAEIAAARAAIGRRGAWSWRGPAAVALSLAAVGVLAVGLWSKRAEEGTARPVVIGLGAGDQLLGDVSVRASGRGQASGAGRSWEIAWSEGSLAVEVPSAGAHQVVVRTPEAVITVVGTGFAVVRDALGTAVEVGHGTVRVACSAGPQSELGEGQRTLCLPATAAGLLGRARALGDAGASDETVLEALDAGLALSSDTAVGAELDAARIGPLIGLGRPDQALEAAERYLGSDQTVRRIAIRRAAASLALTVGGCERALEHLRAIEVPTEAERAQRDACSREREPRQ